MAITKRACPRQLQNWRPYEVISTPEWQWAVTEPASVSMTSQSFDLK
jgi:hypothetical protein